MFKRRSRTVAATGGSDLPFCAMCGQSIRLDSATGRCALGHRVAVAAAPVAPAGEDVTAPLPVAAIAAETDGFSFERDSFVDHYQDTIAWEPAPAVSDSVPASPAPQVDALDEFIAWEQPGGGTFSALDVDTENLVGSADVEDLAPEDLAPADEPPLPLRGLGNDLLDELDDAAHARRQAVGTIGATVAVSGMVFVAIAALPF